MALSILVVSKAATFRRSLTRTLEGRGHAVSWIGTLAEVQAWSQWVDLAVFDLELLGGLSTQQRETAAGKLMSSCVAQRVVFVTGDRPPAGSVAWASGRGPVLHKSRLHELMHIIKMQRRSRPIEMPSSVTDQLRVNQPIGPLPQAHDLTSLR